MFIEQDKLDKLVSFYKNNGFTNSEIKKTLLTRDYPFDRIDELESAYPSFCEKISDLGYNENQIHSLALTYPKSIFDHKSWTLRDAYIRCMENPEPVEEDEKVGFNFAKVREILEMINIPKKRIDLAFQNNYGIIFMKPQVILDNIKFYLNCGMSEAEITTFTTKHLRTLEYGEKDYKELLKELALFGIDKSGLAKIFKNYIKDNNFIDIEDLTGMLRVVKSKKIDRATFGKGLVTSLYVSSYKEATFNERYQDLLDLGFSETQTCNIISRAISVLSMTKEALKSKVDLFAKYVIAKQEALATIDNWPEYFTLSRENLEDKLDVAYHYGLLWFVLEHPANLIQGSELTEARAIYLKTYYPELEDRDYARDVYTCQATFIRKYNKTNEEVKQLLNN